MTGIVGLLLILVNHIAHSVLSDALSLRVKLRMRVNLAHAPNQNSRPNNLTT